MLVRLSSTDTTLFVKRLLGASIERRAKAGVTPTLSQCTERGETPGGQTALRVEFALGQAGWALLAKSWADV